MQNKFNYFKQERTILSTIIDLDNESMSTSDELILFIQTQINNVYHVVIDRALYDNMLYGRNLVIVYTLDNKSSNILTCNNYTLTDYSKNKLLYNYHKLIKSKKIIVYYGLQP